MQLSVHLVRFPWPGGPARMAAGLRRTARAAEEAGAGALSVADHLLGTPRQGPIDRPVLEGYAVLAYLAGVTASLRLRTLVTAVTFRHPGPLVKGVTTLDVLSGGRAELGLGAAWFAREHRGLGVPFPPLAERFDRLEETLQIAHQMWSDDDGPFRGRHYRLAETICSPQPVSRPHPRIIVGGLGERRTLPLVARYADGCNLLTTRPDEVAHKLAVLRAACAACDRPYEDLGKSVVGAGDLLTAGHHDRFVARMARCAELGVDEVCVVPPGPRPEAWVARHCGAVAPRLAELGPA